MTILKVTFEELIKKNNYVLTKGEIFPDSYYNSIFYKEKGKFQKYDLYTPLTNGKEWLYELTALHQPRTGEVLLNGGELKIVGTKKDDQSIKNLSLVQEVNGRMINIFREFAGYNPSDDNYTVPDNRMNSLPETLRSAYYHRFLGLSILNDVVIGTASNLLMKDISNWNFIDSYLGRIRKKKKYLPFIEEVIPLVKPDSNDDPYFNFSCFLNVGNHKWGDVFFVKTHIRDGVIYYIKDHDVLNMMILSEPVVAMDKYHEHILLNRKERFDFMPFTSKI